MYIRARVSIYELHFLLIFINLKLFSSENNRKMKNTMVDVNIKFGEEGREEWM